MKNNTQIVNDDINGKQIIVYENGEVEVKVSLDNKNETIWLRTEDIALLFGVNRPAIVKHIGNIYKSGELEEKSTCSILEQVTKDGKKRKVKYYNLDIIISVGYRVNSVKATKFRQWATKILKQYIINGYAINSEKITVDRFLNLENDVISLKQDIQSIKKKISNNQIELRQGIFYNGQIFDAYTFINNLFKNAKEEIILIDNYIDDSVLILFSKYSNINFTIITKKISKQLKLDIEKYNAQYNNLNIKISNKFHDRFLLIDNKEAYHIGASLKDLGKKVFAFNKIDIDLLSNIINI
jgi:hypothetical protein